MKSLAAGALTIALVLGGTPAFAQVGTPGDIQAPDTLPAGSASTYGSSRENGSATLDEKFGLTDPEDAQASSDVKNFSSEQGWDDAATWYGSQAEWAQRLIAVISISMAVQAGLLLVLGPMRGIINQLFGI